MVVQHNMQAANASRTLNITSGNQGKSTEKLSSGYRINRAADDAAGLSISEKMRKQIRGLSQASTNASDGVSSVQTAEGALTEVHDMLQRMNELAVQAANGTNSESDRDDIQNEITQLSQEIDRIASTTKFNETFLLKGDIGLKRMYVNAHDAGLEGTLVQNTTRATFQMETLTAGEKYRIGGVQYTIGAMTNAEVAHALHLDDKITGGTTKDNPGVWNLDSGDTISIDGKTYTILDKTATSSDVGNAKITNGYLKNLIVEGSTVKYNGNEVTRFSKSYKAATGIDGANTTLIRATAAYNMVAIELKAASSVGTTDGAAETVNKGTEYSWVYTSVDSAVAGGESDSGTSSFTDTIHGDNNAVVFTLDKGFVNVQNALTLNLHVGADAAMSNKINVTIEAMNSKSIGINGINVSDATGKAATYAIDAIADAIQRVSAQRAELGAIQNRLEHSIANLDNVVENTEAAESRIRDTDMADQMVEYSKNNILQQAGQSMLAQANQATQGVLSLLQ
ncbi:MAG: flagellar hook protein [Pseudobutyrivibrio sp.]|nr:flagellar hook protein [Pseudobutyrivibrio sp.]